MRWYINFGTGEDSIFVFRSIAATALSRVDDPAANPHSLSCHSQLLLMIIDSSGLHMAASMVPITLGDMFSQRSLAGTPG